MSANEGNKRGIELEADPARKDVPVSVLIVAPDNGDRPSLAGALRALDVVEAVDEAGDFQHAAEALVSRLPDVLITELRLGAYNGLHLVLRAKARRPRMKAIVVARSVDPVLQQEAARCDAEFLVKGNDDAWIGSIVTAIGALVPDRQVVAMRRVEGD